MARYELSLSPDYVIDWKVTDAIRELFQNALDQQTTDAANTMFFRWDAVEQALYIGNKDSTLDKSTLLLGKSTKRDDKSTIGKFGEGYKIAALVLTRLGHKMTIYNYGNREVWCPRLIDSRRYGSKILVFEIDSKYFWQDVPDDNLVIKIEGITPQHFENIKASNLHLQTDRLDTLDTRLGRVLLNPEQKGKLYVNGLYICTMKELEYGYDLPPDKVNLDRDRRIMSGFDVQWLTSGIWRLTESDLLIDMTKREAYDTHYLGSTSVGNVTTEIADKAFDGFVEEYGDNAVPVTNQAEMERVNRVYGDEVKPVIVNSSYNHIITSSPVYKERVLLLEEQAVEVDLELAPKEVLEALYSFISYRLTDDDRKRFKHVIKLSEHWIVEE